MYIDSEGMQAIIITSRHVNMRKCNDPVLVVYWYYIR